MRLKLTIFICKLLRKILKLLGRGSSMPGRIALKLYPSVLKKVALPKYVIAVTGSNGKTSTVEMIYEILTKAGLSVAYNNEGSNQIDGVATLILSNCTPDGVFKKQVLLIETDERYAQYTFKYFVPTHYVITNIYRDQMTRNGNYEFVLNEIKKSIYPSSKLILNCDDPNIASLAGGNKCFYFGINENKYSKKENDYLYDDGYYCPKCKAKLIYNYRNFAHVGNYRCSKCNFSRKYPDYYISNIDLGSSLITINEKYDVGLALKSIYNAYNVLSAYAVCNVIGVKPELIAETLSNYLIRNGRVKQFKLGKHEGTLLISKHENSVSYNQNIEYVVNGDKEVNVLLIVDSISRKYFTSDTSWLWDINFELLKKDNVKKIIVTGLYSADICERLSYADINFDKVYVNSNITEALNYLKENGDSYIYALTCFSDEAKLLKEVNVR